MILGGLWWFLSRFSKVSPGPSEEWRRHGSDRSATCPEGAASGSPGLLMDNYAFGHV